MATQRLIGKDFTPSDVVAKVTGRAKYSEDFSADGMAFCRLYSSPMPHGRVRNIDASAALAMEGVLAVMTADDVPAQEAPNDAILTNEPLFVGDPILAVAAVDETTAANAVDAIKVDLEPLPFVIDPLDSLFPGGPNARLNGNVANVRMDLKEIKWTARDFASAKEGEMPMGEAADEWSFGDLDAGFADAKLVLDETFVTAGHAHHAMEPRTTMAYWQNGKCYLHGSVQSTAFSVPGLARYVGVDPADLVFIAEYCGGGFGGKGTAYPTMAIPAFMSKMISRPVMMRISRSEEYAIGRGRPGFQGRVKIGLREDGRITAVDVYIVHDNGPNIGPGDWRAAGLAISMVYQPLAMRWRGVPVLTNTPPRGYQRGPGENQIANIMEPILDKAAEELGIDRVALRRLNAPDMDAKYGPDQGPVTSARLPAALDQAAERFKWAEKLSLSGQRNGSKVTGIGVGQAYHNAGANGFDGLVRITPDGILHIHTGIGNLGTFSFAACSRVPAEVLNYDWANCVIERGDTSRGLPWTFGQFGSNTSFTMTRAMYAGAMDAKQKLLEIAAVDLGGEPDDYVLANERVVSKLDGSKAMSYAKLAQRAIELGGKFDGHELPEDINPMTQRAATLIAGSGLVGVAKDNLERNGRIPALTVGMAQIELDLDTGKVEIIDYIGVSDCGTVLHPQSLASQTRGGAVQGFGEALTERYVFDPKLGLPANIGFYQCKPPSYLDVPSDLAWGAVDLPDPQNPVGSKGVGEPVMGAGSAAVTSAIRDALGGHMFNRTPVLPDMIVNVVAGLPQSYKPLSLNTQ